MASSGSLTVSGGTMNGNTAARGTEGYSKLHVSGGTISGNAATEANGGAVNVEPSHAGIYLSGRTPIFNNPGNAATVSQKNVVLSEDDLSIINTEGEGLKEKTAKGVQGTVGNYVINGEGSEIYKKHGIYDKPFGTFGGDETEIRLNAMHLVNDRDLSLYGTPKRDDYIYWLNVVCKVTDSNDVMLYKLINVDESGVNVYAPAVYASLEDGMNAISGTLYCKSGSRYVVVSTGAVKVKMLKDYTLYEDEIITYTKARDVTLTTAETSITPSMRSNGDSSVYTPVADAEGESRTKATLTRGQTEEPMFTVNTRNRFHTANLIIDGGNTEQATDGDGAAFHMESLPTGSSNYSMFTGVTFRNLNVTGNGGAVYLNAGGEGRN